jgi:hypothetical protein
VAEEMMLESSESDEVAEDWESDEALMESDESAEDIGERARRRRQARSYYRPARRPVKGITLRGQDGRARHVPFPAKLATAEETNRGLATQEVGRRALEERLDRLDTRLRVQQRKDASIAGLVTLLIGGGLTAFGIFEASKQSSGSRFSNWANQGVTKAATLASMTHVAASGAKLAINGRYQRSGLGIAADAFATSQIAAFLIGKFHDAKPRLSTKLAQLRQDQTDGKLRLDFSYVDEDTGVVYETFQDANNQVKFFQLR